MKISKKHALRHERAQYNAVADSVRENQKTHLN